ncbi:histidine phosphatase family protein [Lysinibacillus sp. KU-BSD001]|uniref:histidine phosphatase family protein n=1 Tax=Lysinibacillus sp. KU-BSD001 TaxID=3141328 RepID=UPI0036E743E8
MCKTIRIYRHGETEWNKQGVLQGWLDSPLTEYGKQQVQDVDWQPDIVYASDLQRAISTATWMFPNMEIHTDARLREIYLGDWQGQPIVHLQQQVNYQYYSEAPEKFIADSQESFEQVANRLLAFLQSIKEIPQQQIAVVSHGVAIACLQWAIEKRSLATLWQKGMLSGGDFISLYLDEEEWYLEKITLQKI